MEPQHEERRLTTILAADVVGYSRLMAADDSGTHAQLKTHRKELLEPKTAEYHGRVVKLMGDGTLMEFASVVDAVKFAVDVQQAMGERNAWVPEDRQIKYRIGINIGDIIVEGDDIFGDGVNVAARLEALAEPGGICIARNVFNEVKNKLELDFDDIGEQEVKNIPEPVRVYRVLLEPEAAGKAVPKARRPSRSWKWPAAAAIALLAAMGAVATWLWPWTPDVEPASVERMAFPLPEKPSIAVLPFANISGDPEQEYFADGITDDLITDLSRVSGLFVIARNSVFTYKGTPVKVQQVAEELGVGYVLEGSIRRAQGKVRINAQLIDATTGKHLWAERYDRDYKDIFALQDEVVQRIVSALSVKLTQGEKERLARRYTDNLEAYDFYHRGEQSLHSFSVFVPSLLSAQLNYEKAIELDPNFARAYVGYAMANYYTWRLGFVFQTSPWIEARERAFDAITKALALNATLPRAHSAWALLQLAEGKHDEAAETAARAIALDPNNADGYLAQALVLSKAGRHEEATGAINKAYRLNPKPPPHYDLALGEIQFGTRQYAEAVENLEKARRNLPDADVHMWHLAPSLAHLGRLDEARVEVAGILGFVPFENLMRVRLIGSYKLAADAERYVEGFRMAGLPELPYGYTAVEDRKVGGQEVRTLLFGRTVTATNVVNFQQYLVDRTLIGDVTIRGPWGTDTGTSRIDGDMVCDRMQAYGFHKSCGFVFRNPRGTPEKRNEYHWVNDSGVFAFSPAN